MMKKNPKEIIRVILGNKRTVAQPVYLRSLKVKEQYPINTNREIKCIFTETDGSKRILSLKIGDMVYVMKNICAENRIAGVGGGYVGRVHEFDCAYGGPMKVILRLANGDLEDEFAVNLVRLPKKTKW